MPELPLPRALVVDDEPLLLKLALFALRRDGFAVTGAQNGLQALELAARERPDVIVLDVKLPDLDGPEVLARLRAEAATARIPVVFLTATTEPAERARLLAMDVAGLLVKPFDPRTLGAQIRRALG